MSKVELVKKAMLSVQRYPWEQGVCLQALWEIGDETTAVAMAHDAVLRQKEDGRLAVINDNIAITDPACNGEGVLRAFYKTNDEKYKISADKMLYFLMNKANRTPENILCHNEVSFHEGFSPDQVWVDSIYMAPPFIAAMGNIDEAVFQIDGMYKYLIDCKSGVLRHIYDAKNKAFVRDKLWATGNGWALLGMARVIEHAINQGEKEKVNGVIEKEVNLLDSLLNYQLPDGRFHDILDDENSFVDGASATMMAAAIYRGVKAGWLDEAYIKYADLVYSEMDKHIDEYGIIHGVCGCPDFLFEGTSAESMAAYLMMHAWHDRYCEK